jgi:hypothetical protein
MVNHVIDRPLKLIGHFAHRQNERFRLRLYQV